MPLFFIPILFLSCSPLDHSVRENPGGFDISRELSLWESPPRQSEKVRLDEKVQITLERVDSSFVGLVPFEAPASGLYRFSLNRRLWIDVIETESKKTLDPERHAHAENLPIRKMVLFRLEKNVSYVLELSSPEESPVLILVTRERKSH